MIKYGIYRVDQDPDEGPYTELYSGSGVRVSEEVYWFYGQHGTVEALYPVRSFYVVALD